MKTAKHAVLVLVTAPDMNLARKLAGLALKRRLIACANLIPKVESHYRWQGKVECGTETLMVLKTSSACVRQLETLILAHHPYDTPEFVTLKVAGANERYLGWWMEASQDPRGKLRKPTTA